MAQTWSAAGPEVIRNGQTEGISPNGVIPNPTLGGVKVVLPVPGQSDQLLLGSTNGGIWRTTDLSNGAGPSWTNVTPAPTTTSHSIGAMAFNLLNSGEVYAGFGDFSSFAGMGGPLNGLLFSNNSGQTWAPFNAPNLTGVNISGLVARGNGVVVVSGNSFTFNTQESTSPGLYRPASTTNLNPGGGGPNAIINIAGNGTSGLPRGDYTDVVNAPGNLSAMYTAVVNTTLAAATGIYRSTDAGQTWDQVYTAPANTVNIRLSGRDNTFAGASTVFGAIVTGASNFPAQLNQVVRTANDGTSWQNMNIPTTGEAGGPFGIHPGGQGQLHLSIVADPTNADVVYIGGDRQPAVNDGANNASFPNALGANDYTGRLFRGTFDPGTSNTAWAAITHNQTNSGNAPGSAPHADSRSMAFVGSNLIEGDDGGIYQQSNPTNNTGVWSSKIGTGLQISEVYGVAYDRISNVLMGSNQDTGAVQQRFAGGTTYDQIPTSQAGLFQSGDGGVIFVDNVSQAGAGRSVRYSSANGVSNMQRAVYDAANNPVGAPVFLTLNERNGANAIIGNIASESFSAKTPAPFVPNRADPTGQRMVVGTSYVAANAPNPEKRAAVWESSDGGNNFTQVGANLGVNESVVSLVSGGQVGANNFPNVLFVGTDNPAIYRRPAAGGGLTQLTGYGGGTPWDLAMDPLNWASLFAVDITNNRIWRSINADNANAANVAFANITANLMTVAGANFVPQTIEYVSRPTNIDLLLVGGLGGVYMTPALGAVNWSLLGTGMPDVTVMDLNYDPVKRLLVAGTLGRGMWIISIPVPEPGTGILLIIALAALGSQRRYRL